MSFREKSAWVTLIAILLVFTMYFLHIPSFLNPRPSDWQFHVLVLCFATFIAIEVVAHIVLYLRYWKDARTPKDEREQLLELKATRLAARIFVVGSFLAIMTTHHGATGPGVAYFVLMAFAIAEIVNYAARIIYYRRG